jgi:hypothetical protein
LCMLGKGSTTELHPAQGGVGKQRRKCVDTIKDHTSENGSALWENQSQ